MFLPMDTDSDVTVGSVQPLIGGCVREGVLATNLIGDAQRRDTYTVD